MLLPESGTAEKDEKLESNSTFADLHNGQISQIE